MRLELQTKQAQDELSAALAELRGSLQPAVHLVEKGAEVASAGLDTGARLLGAVSGAGGSVAGAAQAVAQKLGDVAAPLTEGTTPAKAGQLAGGAGLAGLALWGVKRLMSKEQSAGEPVPEGALPAVLNALLPRKTSELTDAGGEWLKEADQLRREADRQLNRIEKALARGQGDADELILHRDEVLETLTNGLKIAFSRGLDGVDAATKAHVLAKRGEDYAAHLALAEAEAGGGGLTGALRRHPLLIGGAVVAAGAAAAIFLPRSAALAKAAPMAASLAKDLAVGLVSRTGLVTSLAGFAWRKLSENRAEPVAETPEPAPPAVAEPPLRMPLVLDQYGAPANRG